MIKKTILICLILIFHIGFAQANDYVRVKYAKPVNKIEMEIKKELKESNIVNVIVSFINDNFQLPERLTFFLGSVDGPLYDGRQNQIEIPFGFITEITDRFSKEKYNDKTGITIKEARADVLMHTLFHELAHAFISMYEIPVLGKEEDAADALAAILLIEYFENGQEIALTAADLFSIESYRRNGELQEEDFWDEHSLDEQRYYSTLCYIYGSNPEQYAFFVKEGSLSQERADMCIEEYEKTAQDWLDLLGPYMKHDDLFHRTRSSRR